MIYDVHKDSAAGKVSKIFQAILQRFSDRFMGEESISVFMTLPGQVHPHRIKYHHLHVVMSVIHIHMMRMVADGLEIGEQGIKLMIK